MSTFTFTGSALLWCIGQEYPQTKQSKREMICIINVQRPYILTRRTALDHYLLNIAFFVQEEELFLYKAAFIQEEELFLTSLERLAKFFSSDV